MDMNKICIIFAGCVGSSKTPISNYLSPKLELPIFNNDAIRSEVIEDKWFLDHEEHLTRRDARIEEILESWISFIADVSADRVRGTLREKLSFSGYRRFVISMDLTKELLIQLYQAKWYSESLQSIDRFLEDHAAFLAKYSNDVWVHITDDEFHQRLEIAYTETKKWIASV